MKPEMRGYTLKKSPEEYIQDAEAIEDPKYYILGVVGGMGPAATIDLQTQIINLTSEYVEINGDQDHLSSVTNIFPEIPDRTDYILYEMGLRAEKAEDPYPYLLQSTRKLLSGKPKPHILAYPCNTAHYYVSAVEYVLRRSGEDFEIVHMIRETAEEVRKKGITTVGLLATSGTLQTRLYHQELEALGISVVTPTQEDQRELVMDGIYGEISGKGVKKGFIEEPRQQFLAASEKLRELGAEAVIEGCTEIPIALKQEHTAIPLINPTEVQARRMIEKSIAKGK